MHLFFDTKNDAKCFKVTVLNILRQKFGIYEFLRLYDRLLSGQYKVQTADCRLQTADCRLQTGYKMQTETKIGYKLQTVREECF